jgi:hypothetical protein
VAGEPPNFNLCAISVMGYIEVGLRKGPVPKALIAGASSMPEPTKV